MKILPEQLRRTPLKSSLAILTVQELDRAKQRKELDREMERLHSVLAQIASKEKTPQAPVITSTKPNKLEVNLDSNLLDAIKSQASRIVEFITSSVAECFGVDKKRVEDLSKLIRDFNLQEDYITLNGYLQANFSDLADSCEIMHKQEAIIDCIVEGLPNTLENPESAAKANFMEVMRDLHVLLFDSRLDECITKSTTKQDEVIDLFKSDFDQSYKFWIKELDKFYKSNGKQVSSYLQNELLANFDGWTSFLVFATAQSTLKLNKEDPEKYPLKSTLQSRFKLLASIRNLLPRVIYDHRDEVLNSIDDFNREEPSKDEPELGFIEYIDRIDPAISLHFEGYRNKLIEDEIIDFASSLNKGSNLGEDIDSSKALTQGDDISLQSTLREEDVLKKFLPRLYTLITGRKIPDPEQVINDFFQVKKARDEMLELRVNAFLKCHQKSLKDIVPLIMQDLPMIITKLVYESIVYNGTKIGYDDSRLLEFIKRLDSLEYDLQPSSSQA